jgi:ribosomal protein S27AE
MPERDVPMHSRSKSIDVTCTRCGTAAALPENRDHSGLWAGGWRWIGSLDLFSCPDCPPVVIVDEHGQHLLPQ